MFVIIVLFALLHFSSGVLYELSVEDYARMPPMFRMDDYEGCFEDPQGLYCSTKFAMVSDEPSPLLTMMQEHSQHYPSHYNHTLLRRGICITRTCKQYYDESEGDLGSALEACANETFYNEYKLKTRVLPDFDCAKRERNHSIDYLDIVVAFVCVAILVTNVVASVRDFNFEKEKICEGGVRYLYCFSIFRNWKRLVTSPAAGRHHNLTVIHGMRALTMFLVIGCHSVIKNVIAPENDRFIENMYSSSPMHILFNGTLIMQTFLFISSFLLVYNWLIHSEKQKPTWKLLPHVFMIRWLRLTPSYALLLAITATWYGKLASGPAWQSLIGNEMNECRRVWWTHLLYINNYNDNPECMLHTWYLAADTQLYLMAAIVFLLCQTARMRKVVLSLLFVIGLAIPTVITYLRNLEGALVTYPEFTINIFKGSSTFNNIYQRSHTNIPGYVFGMAVAYWVYDRQKTGGDHGHLRALKYRLMYWALVPLAVLLHYSGTIYYSFSPPSTFINLLCAAFMKPTYAIFIGVGVAGAIFRVEDVYRTILEWPIWTVPSRLSFSAYLLHFAILRSSLAMQTTTFTATPTTVVTSGLVLIAQSVVAGFFYYLLVEGPFTAVVREYYRKQEPIEETKDKDSKKKEEDNEINESIKTNGSAIISDNSARKRVFNNVIDKSTILSHEKNR